MLPKALNILEARSVQDSPHVRPCVKNVCPLLYQLHFAEKDYTSQLHTWKLVVSDNGNIRVHRRNQ